MGSYRKKAKDYGDDPSIRRRYGEAQKTSKQPWEVRYKRKKKKRKRR